MKETISQKKERVLKIIDIFDVIYGDADCTLDYDDAWKLWHYDRLFVGSDYKGTERFLRYEAYFADKGVEIVYFPYTQGTSSTQLRDYLDHVK